MTSILISWIMVAFSYRQNCKLAYKVLCFTYFSFFCLKQNHYFKVSLVSLCLQFQFLALKVTDFLVSVNTPKLPPSVCWRLKLKTSTDTCLHEVYAWSIVQLTQTFPKLFAFSLVNYIKKALNHRWDSQWFHKLHTEQKLMRSGSCLQQQTP